MSEFFERTRFEANKYDDNGDHQIIMPETELYQAILERLGADFDVRGERIVPFWPYGTPGDLFATTFYGDLDRTPVWGRRPSRGAWISPESLGIERQTVLEYDGIKAHREHEEANFRKTRLGRFLNYLAES